ncbi:hypothetical protein FBU30_009495 [Linnemannia zychae]|nr:hypothetical protein FBU30_009495 [Linnemannia zychae]
MSFISSILDLLQSSKSFKYSLIVLAYMALVRHLRYHRINGLLKKYPDPTLPLRDLAIAKEVIGALGGNEFPYMNVMSLEFALFKTYSIPTISKILAATRQFSEQALKRSDDTGLILGEMIESPKRQLYRRLEGKADTQEDDEMDAKRQAVALQKLNFIHGHYPIQQKDYLYTLALFIMEPAVWIDRFEWRQTTDLEKNALLAAWTEIGKGMKIENIPTTYDGLVQWVKNFEHENTKYAQSNVAIAHATTSLLLSRAPRFLHPFGRHVVSTLLTDRLRTAFAIPSPPIGMTTAVVGLLKLRGYFIRYFMLPRKYPVVRTALQANKDGKFVPRFNKFTPVYPNGYFIEDLGPSKFIGKCPVSLKSVQVPAGICRHGSNKEE